MKKNSHIDLPFDQYSRQMHVLKIINSLRKNNQSFKILDVGGYKGATASLHKLDEVIVMDLFDVTGKGYIKGSALDMPFKDEEFDFIVSFDVFEHIENKDRRKFIEESARVSKIGVITAAPVSTAANTEAERSLNDLYKSLHGTDHPWLEEHISYGLPKIEQAKTLLEKVGMKTALFTSNDIFFWALMQGAIFLNSKHEVDPSSIDRLNALYNSQAINDGSASPEESYRHIVCGFKSVPIYETAKKYNIDINFLSPQEKIKIIDNINNHYKNVLESYESLVMATEKKFQKKITEKDILQQTINNIESERDALRSELDSIKKSVSYRAINKLSSNKKR